MTSKVLLILAIFGQLAVINHVSAQKCAKWKLARNQNNIKIFVRKHKNSGLKEVLGITEIDANLGTIISFIKDIKNHPKWMYANKQTLAIETRNEFERILHSETEAPWPVANRDLVTLAKMTQDKSTGIVYMSSKCIPDFIPAKDGVVRIRKMSSSWELIPQKNGKTIVKFELMVDPGGNIPYWIINMAVDRGPFNTLLNMKTMIKEKQYQNKTLSYIVEKYR